MKSAEVSPLLIRKYNKPVPRYTSYPTVPFWKELEMSGWAPVFAEQFGEQNPVNGISLYLHLPFCESLCTYCGCNKKITTNHKVEEEYLDAIEKEWMLYRKLMKQTPVLRELHLGGGTPSFFSPKNLKRLLEFILRSAIIHPNHEFSIEGHPNNTTPEHLQVLYALGFRRISYGVQDMDPEVQRIINRPQPFENVKAATEAARAAGFTSINFDLIYGLPLQTEESIERTFGQVISLKPARIAFYSYAHVPWTSKAQRLFDESHLPAPEQKIALYLKGRQLLTQAGYEDIGMDHFALPGDELYKARVSGTLHRNFMGYTTRSSKVLIGLGVSAISDVGSAFAQNEKSLHDYYAAIRSGKLPITRGYLLSEEDIAFRHYIQDISCRGKTSFHPSHSELLQQYVFPCLEELFADGMIEWNNRALELTSRGHLFIRNVCRAFDLFLQRNETSEKIMFSKAI